MPDRRCDTDFGWSLLLQVKQNTGNIGLSEKDNFLGVQSQCQQSGNQIIDNRISYYRNVLNVASGFFHPNEEHEQRRYNEYGENGRHGQTAKDHASKSPVKL